MSAARWIALLAIPVIAIAIGVTLRGSAPATAFQGSDCRPYSLPKEAEIHEVASDPAGNTITIVYRMPDGKYRELTVPFDAAVPTCPDARIRGIVTAAQKARQESIAASCKFVADVLSGRVTLPPGKGDYYNLEYARQWYEAVCR